jgi:class 3 adenylate cyclase
MKCPHCDYDNPKEYIFCGMCGFNLVAPCTSCGYKNPPDMIFCGMCGVRLPENESIIDKISPPLSSLLDGSEETHRPGILAFKSSSPVPSAISGERRLASVLVCDVTGSTTLIEKLGTERWVSMMNKVLHLLEIEVYRYGGKVYQFRGDGLIAIFGLNITNEDDPERCLLTALSMQNSISKHSHALHDQYHIDIQLRIGVSTGEVIIAKLGREEIESIEALGTAVIMASLMESSAQPGTILVSDHTYELVKNYFTWQRIGEITSQTSTMVSIGYRPIAPNKDAKLIPNVDLPIPIVGRDLEISMILHSLEKVYEGVGSIVSLTAERGMGKYFLIDQVHQQFERQSALFSKITHKQGKTDILWIQVRCRSYDQWVPYSPWIDIFYSWLNIKPERSEKDRVELLLSSCVDLWGGEFIKFFPYIAVLLSLNPGEEYQEYIHYLDASALRQRIFVSVRAWLEAIANKNSIILTFHDLHWSDPSGFELLDYCLNLSENHPIAWLLSYSLERDLPVWEFHHKLETIFPHRLTRINLLPLSDEKVGEVIDHIVGVNVLPEETRNLIIEISSGNPYFIRELVQSLIQQGVLAQDADTETWCLTRSVMNIDLPTSLHALLLAQIDRVSPEQRFILQMASIIGNDFWIEVLSILIPSSIELRKNLNDLLRLQLINEWGIVPDLGMHYTFKNSLFRDVVYETLLREHRRLNHLIVADFIENTLNIDFFAQHFGLLAYQYAQAQKPNKELFYTLQFAEQIKRVFSNLEALELYNRALTLLDELSAQAKDSLQQRSILETRFEVLKERIDIYQLIGRREEQARDSNILLQIAESLNHDSTWTIDALLLQLSSNIWQDVDQYPIRMNAAQKALLLSRKNQDRDREISCLEAMTRIFIMLGDRQWCQTGEDALSLARQMGVPKAEARLLILLGENYSWSDQPEKGMAYLSEAIPICQLLNDKISEIDIVSHMSLKPEREGNYYSLLHDFTEICLQRSREINYLKGETEALYSCGQIKGIYLGAYEQGLTLLLESREKSINPDLPLYTHLREAQILTYMNRLAEAKAIIEMLQSNRNLAIAHTLKAGLRLVSGIILSNTACNEVEYQEILDQVNEVHNLVATNPMVSIQYSIAANCLASFAHNHLGHCAETKSKRAKHRRLSFHTSQRALDDYIKIGFVQIIECTSEEIFYRHGLALRENNKLNESMKYIEKAQAEILRKFNLIPDNWENYRKTYLELPLHQAIMKTE